MAKPTWRHLVLILASGVLLQIIFSQPFFGLMDDASNLSQLLPKIQKQGLLAATLDYLKLDLQWGMFRLTYPSMVYFLYGLGASFGPTVFFLLNAVFVMGILYLNAHVFSLILKIDKWLLLLFMAAFPYTFDLFQHPSLQEKMVMLWGASLLWACHKKNLTGIIVFAALGFFSKASFCIYIPMGFLTLLSASQFKIKKDKLLLGVYILASCSGVLFLAWVASKGSYTARYSPQNILHNLKSLHGIFFLAILSLSFFILIRFKKISQWIPWTGVLSFIVVFLPWHIGAYLQSVIAPTLAALSLQVAILVFPKKKYWASALGVLAITVTSYRSYGMFTRLRDIKNIVTLAPTLEQQGVKLIWVPCWEGRGAMEYYLKDLAKTKLEVRFLNENTLPTAGPVFFDGSMCVLPQAVRLDAQCKKTSLYKSKLRKGYELASFECEKTL
ncbi:MAG: hypothetical protein SGI74_09255 [Oligoflexia bacterium]|nr:hypothetical protein [Oligoflexia bacterium]